MTKEIWLNLPVKDIKKSKEFFGQIGWFQDSKTGNSETMAALRIGSKPSIVMLIEESVFVKNVQQKIADTKQVAEIIISFDAETTEEVDEMANKWKQAGGTVFSQPGWMDGWMYGCGFVDIDGHRWNALYMDMSKMPKQ